MDDIDKTIVPRREHISSRTNDVTMPGKRDRKPDGRFAVGDLIMGRYKVLAELGQGGMGVVYRCLDETAGIEVALKALPPELSHNTLEMEDIKENFQLIAKLVHQHIAISKNLECDNSNGNYYLIMECCEGEDLRRWIKRKRKEGQLKLEDVLPIIQQVADALDYAHSEKIIHRDIKPGNIMIDSNGKIKVLDFGLAAQIHTSMTRVSMAYHGTSGTGPYMAPEQWRGRAQAAPADQYALAVMTYEMLAGHLPFESTDASVLREAVLNDTPEEIADIPQIAQDAIKCAMSKEPSERFENCSDFVAALGGKKIKAAKKQSKKSFPKWAAVLIIAALLGAGGMGYYFFDQRQKEEARQEQLAREKAQKITKTLTAAQEAKAKSQWQEVLHLTQSVLQLDATNQHAKSLQDEAKQRIAEIEKQKKQQRMLALKSETYRLFNQIKDKKSKIESDNHDRGQTFGQYLDALKENFDAGETALKNNDFQTANASFKVAKQSAEWIEKNAPLRQQVQDLQNQVRRQKLQADQFNSRKIAEVSYNAASDKFADAEAQYNSGAFEHAVTNYRIAAAKYQEAYQKAKQQTLNNLVATAQAAQNSKKWNKVKEIAEKLQLLDKQTAEKFLAFADQQIEIEKLNQILTLAKEAQMQKKWLRVYNLAIQALKIDNSCSDAKKLKKEAENNLDTTIEIIATVDGKRVPAKVRFGTKLFSTLHNAIKLTENKNYEVIITYQSQNAAYAKKLAFSCDWRGPKKIECQLINYVAEAEKQGLRLSLDKTTIVGVKDQNIKTCNIPFGITVIGDRAFKKCKNLTTVQIPESITSIENRAFYECEKLSNITLPDTIMNIGEFAFYCCKNITYIQIPSNISKIQDGTFWLCEKLGSITIPAGITSIGKEAFRCCESLEYITIPDSIKSIGESAFWGCKKITHIRLPWGITKIDSNSFSLCYKLATVTIPDTVVDIGYSAFSYCKNLTNVTIPSGIKSIGRDAFVNINQIVSSSNNQNLYFNTDGVLINKKNKHLLFAPKNISGSYTIPADITHIGDYAFYDCENLTEIIIPNGVVSIGNKAFSHCTNLTKIVLPEGLKHLGKGTFISCMNLTDIQLPNSLTHIEEEVFAACPKLKVEIPKNVTSMKSNPFICVQQITVSPENTCFYVDKHGALFNKKSKTLVAMPFHFSGHYTIPDGVKNIEDYAFYYLGNLTGVTIPNSVVRIGKNAFMRSSKITEIVIPGSVSDIGESAFESCQALSNVVLCNGVKRIGAKAFYDCIKLITITLPKSVTYLGKLAFYHCKKLTDITIPGKIENIEDCVFLYCENLVNIKLSNGIENIKSEAFYKCKKLVRIILPDSIKSIGYEAFKDAGCEKQVKRDYPHLH